jgi:hypothetical protein
MNLHQEQIAKPVPQFQQQCSEASDLRGLPCRQKLRHEVVQAQTLLPVVVPLLPLQCQSSFHGLF